MIKAAEDNGPKLKKIFHSKYEYKFLQGCEICAKGKDCRFKDDCTEIIDQLAEGASIIIAPQIYFG